MLFIFIHLKPKFNFHLLFEIKWIITLPTPLRPLPPHIYNTAYFTYLVCVLRRVTATELKQKKKILLKILLIH